MMEPNHAKVMEATPMASDAPANPTGRSSNHAHRGGDSLSPQHSPCHVPLPTCRLQQWTAAVAKPSRSTPPCQASPTSTKTPAIPIRHSVGRPSFGFVILPLGALGVLSVSVAKNLCFICAARPALGSLAQSQSNPVQPSPTQSNPVQPSPTQSNPVQPCVNAPISQDMTGIYRIYMLFLNKSSGQTQSNRCLCAVGAEKTNPTDPFKWPEADSHALVGSTPAPGVVFRALAENRARRGISSVRVRFARTTANHRVHAATPGHPGFRIPHLCSIVLRDRRSALWLQSQSNPVQVSPSQSNRVKPWVGGSLSPRSTIPFVIHPPPILLPFV